MTEQQLIQLDDPSAPNVPAKMPGHQGPQAIVPVTEQRDRRAAMNSMLVSGLSADRILAVMEKKFSMTESATRSLVTEVRAMWDDEDSESVRYETGAAKRRMRGHIREASKDRKWTAVAALEKVLSEIEGTNLHEDEKPVDVDSRLSDAILAVLGQGDTKDVRIMIERERAFIELGERENGKLVVTTEGTSSD